MRRDYPAIEPITEDGLNAHLTPEGLQRTLIRRQVIRFRHRDGRMIVQLSARALTLNVLPTYPGWDVTKGEVLRIWGEARDVLVPACIRGVGLRFVHHIPRRTAEEPGEVWFRPGDHIPPGPLRSRPGFLCRSEVRPDPENRVILTLGDVEEKWIGEYGSFVLDVDRIAESTISANPATLGEVLGRLHDDVWRVLREVRTERLASLMEGQEP